jgi:hypothetical protein
LAGKYRILKGFRLNFLKKLIERKLLYNMLIRTIIEGYLEITLASALKVKNVRSSLITTLSSYGRPKAKRLPTH